jgi:hypothetical protein
VARIADFDQVAAASIDAYGLDRLVRIDLGDGLLEELRATLGLPQDLGGPLGQANISVDADLAELVRQLNALEIEAAVRDGALALLQTAANTRHGNLLSLAAQADSRGPEIQTALSQLKPSTEATAEVLRRCRSTGAASASEGMPE